MLQIKITLSESYDEAKDQFIAETVTVELEHSLFSLSKWESKFEKSFLATKEKTAEEALWYVKCMILTPDFPEEHLHKLSKENMEEINEYLRAKMTATWFSDDGKGRSREVITAELIYYWMVSMRIPFECQYWHLNRLLTLIQVHNAKNAPEKKLSKAELLERNRKLNAERRRQYGTKG